MNVSQNNFNSGEMSVFTQNRSDIAKHASGCKVMENFIPLVSGGLVRRPGMRFLAAAPNESTRSRLIGLNFGDSESAVLVVSPSQFRVMDSVGGGHVALLAAGSYVDAGVAKSYSGLPTTHRALPYVNDYELSEIQYVQVNSLVYLVHPSYPVQRITRIAANAWISEEVEWDYAPFADENVTATTLQRTTSGTTNTLTASTAVFSAADVGNLFELKVPREEQSKDVTITLESDAFTREVCGLTTDANDRIICTTPLAHGLSSGDKVSFSSPRNLPDGVTADQTYYVLSGGITNTAFQFADSKNGSPVLETSYVFTVKTNTDADIVNRNRLNIADETPLVNGRKVRLVTSGTLPAPFAIATDYWVRDMTSKGKGLRLASTATGAAITITNAGTGEQKIRLAEAVQESSGFLGGGNTVNVTTNVMTTTQTAGGNPVRCIEGQAITFTGNPPLGPFPPGAPTNGMPVPLLDNGKVYYMREVAGQSFKLSETYGGTIIDITAEGDGAYKWIEAQITTLTKPIPYPLPTPPRTLVQTTPMKVFGKVNVFTFGAWEGEAALWKIERGIHEELHKWTGKGDRNLAVEIEQFPEVEMYLKVNASKVAPKAENETWGRDPRFILEVSESYVAEVVKGTQYVNPTTMRVAVLKNCGISAATARWAETSWSTKRGYPRTVALHQQRLFFGGTATETQTLWFSTVGDFQNFRRSTLDDAAGALTIASSERNTIQWLSSSAGGLIIGTSGDEWTLTAESGVISPLNVQVKKQSSYGSEYLQPVPINEVTMFVQSGGRKLREHVFSFERDGYVSPDLCLLASHILRGGVRAMALMNQPDTILWVLRKDGMLCGLTYERDQSVVAWHRHPTQGAVESIATVHVNGKDQLWLVVRRGERRIVERLDPETLEAIETAGNGVNLCYVDSSWHRPFGLFHLLGNEVDVVENGFVKARRLPTPVENERQIVAAVIFLDDYGATLFVGLPYTSTVHLNSFEMAMNDGSSKGRSFRANRLALHVWQSVYSAEVCGNAADQTPYWEKIDFPSDAGEIDLLTGIFDAAIDTRFGQMPEIAIRQTQPIPLNLLGVIVKGNFHGD